LGSFNIKKKPPEDEVKEKVPDDLSSEVKEKFPGQKSSFDLPPPKLKISQTPKKIKIPTDRGLKNSSVYEAKENTLPPKRQPNQTESIPKSTGIMNERIKEPNRKVPANTKKRTLVSKSPPSRKGYAPITKIQKKNTPPPPSSRRNRKLSQQMIPSRKGYTPNRKREPANQILRRIEKSKVPERSKIPPASIILKEEKVKTEINPPKSQIPSSICEKTPEKQKSSIRRKIPKA